MNTLKQVQTIFFDLGATLVDPVTGPDGGFAGFTLLPGTRDGLDALAGKFKLGVISNTGALAPAAVRKALADIGLLPLFTDALVLLSGEVHMDKSTPAIFKLAADRSGAAAAPGSCLYVGDDGTERRNARRAGMHTSRALEVALRSIKAKPLPLSQPNLSALAACIEDARNAALDSSIGPAEPDDYTQLLQRLDAATLHLPPVYRQGVAQPFIQELRRIGAQGFTQLLTQDPSRQRGAGLMFDIAQAILQNGEGFETVATDAFEEVVSDLYDGFLSAQDRAGLKAADNTVLAPLVKWGNPDSGPYTWPIDATRIFKCQAAVVNLPPANAKGGLFAWAALGHETAGHDILHADNGLEDEMSTRVRQALAAVSIGAGLDSYWGDRIDETASDVMGILNMGPAAGIGLIVYFRALNQAFGGNAGLRNDGPGSDPHPADILRGFLAAATVRLLSFDGAADWAQAIEAETLKDVKQIRINGVPITVERARRSCDIVANTIAATPMTALGGHALIEIQNWRNQDEDIVRELQRSLVTATPIDSSRAHGVYAAHVVAGAALAALSGAGTVQNIFNRMVAVLKVMHDANTSWGPLFVAHPGTISRDLTWVRSRSEGPGA
jgi:hypothetical protein